MATSDRPVVSGVAPGAAELTTGPEEPAVIARGYWEQAWRRFKRDRVALFGAFTIIFLILVAFIGLPIAEHLLGRSQYDINVNAQGYQPLGPFSSAPNATNTGTTFYVLGTSDTAGHDEFLGMLAGFFGGAVDVIVSRATEIVMALPLLLFAIALSFTVGSRLNSYTFFGLFSPGVVTLVIVISAFSWYYPARIVRAQVLSLREKEFVEAARMVGASNMRILRSHLLPHLTGTIIVYATLTLAVNILFEAGLSYLGVGIPQGEPSWGNLINSAVGYYITVPWLMVWPGLGILIATLAFNLLGDGLRDALDPRGGR